MALWPVLPRVDEQETPAPEENSQQSYQGVMTHLQTLQRHTVEVAGQELEMLGTPEPLYRPVFELLGVSLSKS